MIPPGGTAYNHVRVPRSEIAALDIAHVRSEYDASIALREGMSGDPSVDVTTGVTEWAGEWHDAPISVGWDWGVIAGQISVIHPDGIRTNVRIVRDDGSLASEMLTRIYLLEWLESLPWRQAILELLSRAR